MKVFLLFLVVSFSISSFATNFKQECKKIPSTEDGKYCIYSPPESHSSGKIIYFLHAALNTENTWRDSYYYTQQIRNRWKLKSSKFPTVVSISFGKLWLMAEKNSKEKSGLFEKVVNEVIPLVEQDFPNLTGERTLWGESMGALNSIQLSLKTNLFSKVALICAPISEKTPFSEYKDILAYAKKSSAWKYHKRHKQSRYVTQSIGQMLTFSKRYFPDVEAFKTFDPLELVKTTNTRAEYYITVGFYDRFVAYEGTQLFVNQLKKKGVKVNWHPQWGDHCVADINSLADFLLD